MIHQNTSVPSQAFGNPLCRQIILKSNDGSRFIVDGEPLARSSAVFKDMMEFPRPLNQITKSYPNMLNPIDVDISSDQLAIFLQLIGAHSSSTRPITFEDFNKLSLLLDEFDCDEAALKRLKNLAYTLGEYDPWDLLIVASEFDDEAMGFYAMEKMNHEIFKRGARQRLSHLSPVARRDLSFLELRKSWQECLRKAYLYGQSNREDVEMDFVPWDQVCRGFSMRMERQRKAAASYGKERPRRPMNEDEMVFNTLWPLESSYTGR
nr:hypothetical protein L204_06421 [Cryptococcus depauperatus CBS 7855]